MSDIDVPPSKSWKDMFSNLEAEAGYVKKYFTLSTWHFLVIIGIAISGLAAFVYTYEAISDINSNIQSCLKNCPQSDDIKRQQNIQFSVILILSICAILLGLLMAWFFRAKDNQRRLVTLGILTIGIFGVIYALAIKFQTASNTIKLFSSWFVFIFFIILGWYLSTKKYGTKKIEIDE